MYSGMDKAWFIRWKDESDTQIFALGVVCASTRHLSDRKRHVKCLNDRAIRRWIDLEVYYL